MKISDSVYGVYDVEPFLIPLIKTPVVQRLRWVALSNIPSLSYPMISGVSRYAHSLGVAHLGGVLARELNLSSSDKVSLVCAGLLHDAGMPPLGHITEEALLALDIEYDHEESLRIVLLEQGKRFSQMPDGEKAGITEAINKIHGDSSAIFEAIIGEGRLGKYVSSDIDIDNIDNIIRLYRLIFPEEKGYCPVDMANGFFCDSGKNNYFKDSWNKVRKELYTKLMFSIEDFAQKASMKRLIKSFISYELLENDKDNVIDSIRFLNDYQFLNRILLKLESVNDGCQFYSGKYDQIISYGWVESITKQKLLSAKKEILGKNYYFDFIPDKRSKNKQSMSPGALVGVFSYGKITKAEEKNAREELIFNIPDLMESYTPIEDFNSDQLLLI